MEPLRRFTRSVAVRERVRAYRRRTVLTGAVSQWEALAVFVIEAAE